MKIPLDMNSSRAYDPALVDVKLQQQRKAKWDWQGKVTGTEYLYGVKDRNFGRLNHWVFWVRVPNKDDCTVVGPHQLPTRATLAALERRTVVFVRGNTPGHRSECYCKVFLSDPTGRNNRLGISKTERHLLPPWFTKFGRSIRLKGTVATTKGTDANSLVVVVSPNDREQMIRIYFAMRVWVLSEKWVISK
jgi:hypothetical protein